MRLDCINCGAAFEPDKVSRKMRFAVCAYCGTLHNIAEITAKRSGREYVPPPLFLPKGIEVEELDNQVIIRFRHLKTYVVPLLMAGGIFLLGMIVTHVFLWHTKFDGPPGYVPWWQTAGRIVYGCAAAIVLATGYVGIANYVNRITACVSGASTRISTRPLPLRPSRDITYSGIKNVFVRTHQTISDSNSPVGYALFIVTDDDRQVEVMSGLSDPEYADVLRHFMLQGLGTTPRSSAATKGRTRVLFKHTAPRDEAPAKVELSCRSCGAPIPMSGIRKDLLAAACEQCGVIQDVRKFLRHGIARPRRNPGFHPPWQAASEPTRLVVWQRVRSTDVTVALGLTVFGAGLVVAGVLGGLFWHEALYAIAALAAIVLLVALPTVKPWVEGQEFQATADGLAFAKLPAPSLRRRTIPRSMIAQVVSLDETRSYGGYSVMIVTPDNDRVVVLEGLHDWAHALFIEQRIEALLNIEDVTVHNVRRPTPG